MTRTRRFFRDGGGMDVWRNREVFSDKMDSQRYKKIRDLEKKFEKEFEKELAAFDKKFRGREAKSGIFDKSVSRKIARQQGEFIFKLKDQYDEKKKEFVVTFKVPAILKLEEVKMDFKNNVLTLSIEKKQKDGERIFYNSVTQAFRVPNTKAGEKDIKKMLDAKSSTVTVVVPII
jgi:HSP20 family molecular chaperone IbpA